MLAIKLAYRNLVGAGLRTWLNVFVLSFVYVLIIWHYGVIDGWNYQARKDMQAWEVGNGQYWHQNYDPYDFFTLEESHAQIPEIFKKDIEAGIITPVLISQGSVYPEGRIQSVILKGINPDQNVLDLPTAEMNIESEEIPEKEVAEIKPIEFELVPVYFNFDKFSLTEEGKMKLDKLVSLLKNYPDLKAELYGHADGIGPAEYNQKLSEKRALSVYNYLVNEGIDNTRLKTAGLGVSQFASINKNPDGSDNPEGRRLNRRVEYILIGIEEELTEEIAEKTEEVPVIIGRRMAKSCKLKEGDITIIRWRDVNGTFDATEVKIVKVFNCNVPNVDAGQMWIPIKNLQEMMQSPDEATIFIIGENFEINENVPGWEYKSQSFLMTEMDEIIKMKRVGGSFLYLVLILLAMLAIFDTQVLSIFRRQKEIGTYIAMGMTRRQVVSLFTVEGAMHAILVVIAGAIYGVPFLLWQMNTGFSMPAGTDDMGLSIAEKIFPVYGVGLIVSTILLVLIITTIVSYMPARKISKMNPTDAIKGKIQ